MNIGWKPFSRRCVRISLTTRIAWVFGDTARWSEPSSGPLGEPVAVVSTGLDGPLT